MLVQVLFAKHTPGGAGGKDAVADKSSKGAQEAAKAEREKITVPFRAVSTSKSLYQIPVMTHALNVHQDANLQLPSGTTNTTVAGEGK